MNKVHQILLTHKLFSPVLNCLKKFRIVQLFQDGKEVRQNAAEYHHLLLRLVSLRNMSDGFNLKSDFLRQAKVCAGHLLKN